MDVHEIAYKLCTISDRRVGANMKFYIRFALHESISAFHTYVLSSVPRNGRFFYIETVFLWAGNFSKTSISARSAGVGKYKALALLPGKIFDFQLEEQSNPQIWMKNRILNPFLPDAFLSFFCGKL